MQRKINVSGTSQLGRRKTNEDVLTYTTNIKNPNQIDYFCICDGHGGDSVSKFVTPILREKLTGKNISYPISYHDIIIIFNEIDNLIKQSMHNDALYCGTTVLILIRYHNLGDDFVQVINLGDSRAIISKNNIAIPMTIDHKPSCPNETKRIQSVNKKNFLDTIPGNHHIAEYYGIARVCGLSVSRAFGDYISIPQITHHPETFVYKITKKNKYIIMASDGLWDSVSNQEALNFTLNNGANKDVALDLANYAINNGSCDNVSIIIIELN